MWGKIWNIFVIISDIVLAILILATISFLFSVPLVYFWMNGLWWLFGISLIIELAIIIAFIDIEFM